MRISLVIAIGALALATASARAGDDDKKYSMADLKALVDEKHYQEALMHMGDIKPSARKAEWKDLLGVASAGYAASGKDELEKLRIMLMIEEQYPTVVKHAKYAAVRLEAGPKGFGACFSNSYSVDECKTYAIKFIDADPTNGKLVLAVAKVARKGMNPYNSAPLFKRAVAADKKAACKDDDLSYSTVAAMGLPPDYDDFKAGKVVVDACWAELKTALIKAVKEGGYTKDNVCPMLAAKKEKFDAELCVKDKKD
jgi:hypothetical protein